MRKFWLAAWVLLIVVGLPQLASAEAGTGSAQVAALLAEFPKGGPGLRAAVARAIEADPSLAADFVAVGGSVPPAAAEAIGTGLADAAQFFAKLGTGWARFALGTIEDAVASGSSYLSAGFTLAGGSAVMGGPFSTGGIPGLASAAVGTSRCISPSREHGRCGEPGEGEGEGEGGDSGEEGH